MNNFVAWNLQIAAVIACAAFIPWLVRLRMPDARLAFWQAVLVASLVLPFVRTWKIVPVDGLVTVSSRVTGVAVSGQAFRIIGMSWTVVLCTGVLLRLGWLVLGLLRLRRYRASSKPFNGEAIRISDEISSPVTFGFLRPVVILPASFPNLDAELQEQILCHEGLHIERHDWLFTIAEEVLRAVFWFHPAIWWALGQIQLAREQAVDRAVVAVTGSPDRYVDALLAIAGATPQIDLAPAPLFLRRRHLKQRVFSLLKEARMSRRKSLSALAVGLGMMAAACWFVTGAIPLTAAEPQKIRIGGNVAQQNLISQPKPQYPPEAKKARIQGTVELAVEIGRDGKVDDIQLLSGPPELVQSAVDAVRTWEYKPVLLNGEPVAVTTTVVVNYTLQQ
jgi:TonB family protein